MFRVYCHVEPYGYTTLWIHLEPSVSLSVSSLRNHSRTNGSPPKCKASTKSMLNTQMQKHSGMTVAVASATIGYFVSLSNSTGVSGVGNVHIARSRGSKLFHTASLRSPLDSTFNLPAILNCTILSRKSQHISAKGHCPSRTSLTLRLRRSLTK